MGVQSWFMLQRKCLGLKVQLERPHKHAAVSYSYFKWSVQFGGPGWFLYLN